MLLNNQFPNYSPSLLLCIVGWNLPKYNCTSLGNFIIFFHNVNAWQTSLSSVLHIKLDLKIPQELSIFSVLGADKGGRNRHPYETIIYSGGGSVKTVEAAEGDQMRGCHNYAY